MMRLYICFSSVISLLRDSQFSVESKRLKAKGKRCKVKGKRT